MAGPETRRSGNETIYDLAIVGGGVNGCGIARDAAGRGLSVYLCEQDDLASGTSSRSTKLIHGGLRYLEFFEFRLVREALKEREVLLSIAPHIIRPMRFVLPRRAGMRPAWLLRAGLFLYDHLGKRTMLEATRSLDLRSDAAGIALRDDIRRGFEYSDCWVDDARLVVLNAMDARSRGARIETGANLTRARRAFDQWILYVTSRATGETKQIRARALINAAGPWVVQVAMGPMAQSTRPAVRLVRGAHIVVPRLFDHDRSYIFQNSDGRIVFAIPYERDFTLIGTTDEDHGGDLDHVAATPNEIVYLCDAVNAYFREPIQPAGILWSFAGVRPLYDDGATKAQEATRDYVLTLESDNGQAPLLSIFGGKITTYRRLAQAALDKLSPYLPAGGRQRAGWTGLKPLPGGDFRPDEFDALVEDLARRYPFLEADQHRRMARAYGTRAKAILGNAKSAADLGMMFAGILSEAELDYLVGEEFAQTAEDILWRRTKLGLRFADHDRLALESHLGGRIGVKTVRQAWPG